jgi:hypothetical protein
MLTEASPASRYALSFTGGALLMREVLIAAPIYLREHDWAVAPELIEKDNLLQSRTVASGHRLARETVQRLAVLDDADKLVARLQHQERLAIRGGAARERAAALMEADRLRKVILELDEYEHDVLYPRRLPADRHRPR